jgi:hypothetical protein
MLILLYFHGRFLLIVVSNCRYGLFNLVLVHCNGFDDCAECRQQGLWGSIWPGLVDFAITCHPIFSSSCDFTPCTWTLHVTRMAQVETFQQYAA